MLRAARYILFGTIISFLLVGCSSSSESTSDASQDAAMLVALSIIDGVGFHAIDEELNKAGGGAIDSTWLGKVRHAQVAVATVEWPDSLAEKAETFVATADRLSVMLEADDPKGAAGPAAEGHEAQHELSTEAWAELSARADIEAPGHGESTATPAGS